MKKLLTIFLFCIVSIMGFSQIEIKPKSLTKICSNAIGDEIYEENGIYYLSLEFWHDNGLNKKFHTSVGQEYIKIGTDPIYGLNQLIQAMDEKLEFEIYTYDNELLNCVPDWQGGLLFTFSNSHDSNYSVIYKFRIKPLIKKLNNTLDL